jgi:competence protein ComEC
MPKISGDNIAESYMYDRLVKVLNESDAVLYAAKVGDTYTLDSFSFTVLSPCKEYSELNNCSVVIKAYYGNITLLYMGDAEEKAEKDILKSGFDISADIIKIGHHGSHSSTGIDFINAVNPQLAVISCGEYNEYNHPSIETQIKLKSRNIDCYRTDVSGNVVVICTKDSFTVNTER